MKIIKILTLLGAISFFNSVSFNAHAETDCSDPKGFHAKAVCKIKGMTSISASSNKIEKSSTSDNSSKKKGIGGIWKSIKNFGGKNIGEPG